MASEGRKFECPVCHRPLMGPNESCNGSFTESDHPSGVQAVPVSEEPHTDE